jgi:hypothetical protein
MDILPSNSLLTLFFIFSSLNTLSKSMTVSLIDFNSFSTCLDFSISAYINHDESLIQCILLYVCVCVCVCTCNFVKTLSNFFVLFPCTCVDMDPLTSVATEFNVLMEEDDVFLDN